MLMTHSAHSTNAHVSFPPADREPTPEEVSRRVNEIRSSWNLEERLARRHAAEDRFEHLVATLLGGHAA